MSEVYVALVGEGTSVWRPVEALSIEAQIYELLGPMGVGETWEFEPGQRVICELQVFPSGESGLVALRPS